MTPTQNWTVCYFVFKPGGEGEQRGRGMGGKGERKRDDDTMRGRERNTRCQEGDVGISAELINLLTY